MSRYVESAVASQRRIREIVGPRTGEEAAALTALGLLCSSGVNLRAVARDLPDLVRGAFPTDIVGIFWSNPQGEMTDAYVEQPYFLSADVLLSCQRFQEQNPSNWPSFTENVLAGPTAGYLLPFQTHSFYQSEHYAFTYANIGARHILDAVIHDGETPRGCYLFMRSADGGLFDDATIENARAIAALTCLNFAAEHEPQPSTRWFDAGLVVFDADGVPVFHNLAAHQSLWMLARPDGAMLGGDDDSFEMLAQRYCAVLVKRVREERTATSAVSNGWGDFEVRCELAPSGAVAVWFLQRRPLAAHLALKMTRLKLPPRRMTVCWLALMGLPRKEIAHISEISIDTVGEHLNALFAQLNVTSLRALTALLLA